MSKYIRKLFWSFVVTFVALWIVSQLQTNFERAYSVAQRDAAVATLNGGNEAFVGQQIVNTGAHAVATVFTVGYLIIFFFGSLMIYKNGKGIYTEWCKERDECTECHDCTCGKKDDFPPANISEDPND